MLWEQRGRLRRMMTSEHRSGCRGRRRTGKAGPVTIAGFVELRCGSTESLGNLPKFTQPRYVRMVHTGNLAKITELRSERTERPGNMPKITQLSYGSTDRLGYLPPRG